MKSRTLQAVSLAATLLLALAIVALLPLRALIAAGLVGRTLQAAAILLMIWARRTFGPRSFHAAANPTAGGLVTTGPYRFIRHPIYASVLLFTWAAIGSRFSGVTLAIGVVASIATAVRIALEESLVVRRYPEYRPYARRTKRLIPYVF